LTEQITTTRRHHADKCVFHQEMGEKMDDHEIRIRETEINVAVLCNELKGLVTWIKALVGVAITAGLALTAWALQQLLMHNVPKGVAMVWRSILTAVGVTV
jgi:uncharacterized membrane protein YecN with MAPEG domain